MIEFAKRELVQQEDIFRTSQIGNTTGDIPEVEEEEEDDITPYILLDFLDDNEQEAISSL